MRDFLLLYGSAWAVTIALCVVTWYLAVTPQPPPKKRQRNG